MGLNWLISNEVVINPGERTIFHRKDDRLEWLVEVAKDERYSTVLHQVVGCTVVSDTRITGKTFTPVPIEWNSMRKNCDCTTCELEFDYF